MRGLSPTKKFLKLYSCPIWALGSGIWERGGRSYFNDEVNSQSTIEQSDFPGFILLLFVNNRSLSLTLVIMSPAQ